MMHNSLDPLLFIGLFCASTLLVSCDDSFENIPVPMTEQFTQNLTDYDIYQGDLKDLRPTNGYHILELKSILFSNYSKKQRLVKVPTGTQMEYDGNGLPIFPEGTILVKTFYYLQDERDESLGKQVIETRLEILSQGEWNVATYIWNEAQTEATLALNGFDKQVSWITAEGTRKVIDYHFPDQNECVSCHQQNDKVVPIGPSMRNLNVEVLRDAFFINQLGYLQSEGVLTDFDISQVSTLPDYTDTNTPLAERGRAYIDMNCAHCHMPAGWSESATQRMDLRFETTLENSGIMNNSDEISRMITQGEMPLLGNTVVDEAGVDLIIQYLNSL